MDTDLHFENESELENSKFKLEVEKLAHTRWWQEDTLVHHRMTWLLQSQILLYAAYGLVAKMGESQVALPEVKNLLSMLPIIGAIISVTISIGIHAAWKAQNILDVRYRKKYKIKLGVYKTTNTGGKLAASAMPLVFAGGWGWLHGKGLWAGIFFFSALAIVFVVAYSIHAVKLTAEDLE